MKDLNEIQKALEKKAKNEVENLVSNFIKEVNAMNNKYNGLRLFYLGGPDDKRIFCDINNFEKIINNALIERHLQSIVEYKTKELLNKLELI